MDAKARFLNFPIVLLRGFMEYHRKCLNDIFLYSVYKMVFSEDAIFENVEEFNEGFEFSLNPKYIPSIEKKGKELFDSHDGMNYARTGIHIDTFLKFDEPRNEFDLVCLLLFLALKSIVQKKLYAKSVIDDLILSRMAGYSKVEGKIPENICYWMKTGSRRRIKVFTELEKHYKLVKAYKSRGTTFSINKMNQEQLEFAILQKRDQKSDRELNEKKRQAKADADKRWKQSRGQEPPNDENPRPE